MIEAKIVSIGIGKIALRRCNCCGIAKPLDTQHFYRQPRLKSGYHGECKECMNERKKDSRKKDSGDKRKVRWACPACGWVHHGRGLICDHCKSDRRKPADNVAYVVDTYGDMVKTYENKGDNVDQKARRSKVRTWANGLPWG